MSIRRYTLDDMPRGLDLRRSFAFNRRPGERNNRGRVPVAASNTPSTPSSILGGKLLRWIEVGAGSDVVSAGEVTDLLDLSPNGYHMTAVATQRGIYEPTGWNGRPSLSLDAINDFYTDTTSGSHATALVGGTADKSFAVWLVAQFFSVGTIQVPYSCGNSGGTTPFFDLFVNGTPNVARDGWSKYDSNRSATLLSAQWGSNDIKAGTSGATLHTNLTNYVSAIKSKNPTQKVMVATMGWRTGLLAAEETERQNFNTAVRSSLAGADYLLDRDVILTSADAGTLYLDGTHPNAAGNTFMWTGRNGAQGIRDYVIAAGF